MRFPSPCRCLLSVWSRSVNWYNTVHSFNKFIDAKIVFATVKWRDCDDGSEGGDFSNQLLPHGVGVWCVNEVWSFPHHDVRHFFLHILGNNFFQLSTGGSQMCSLITFPTTDNSQFVRPTRSDYASHSSVSSRALEWVLNAHFLASNWGLYTKASYKVFSSASFNSCCSFAPGGDRVNAFIATPSLFF